VVFEANSGFTDELQLATEKTNSVIVAICLQEFGLKIASFLQTKGWLSSERIGIGKQLFMLSSP
jgi:hypothetical protein